MERDPGTCSLSVSKHNLFRVGEHFLVVRECIHELHTHISPKPGVPMGQNEWSPLSPARDGYKGCNRYLLDSGMVSSEFGNMACPQACSAECEVRAPKCNSSQVDLQL